VTLNVLFFGSSESSFSNRHFAALLRAVERRDARLVGVVDAPPAQRISTNPQSTGQATFARVARQMRLPSFAPERTDDLGLVAALAGLAPDLLLSAGYGLILTPMLLNIPRLLAANFHASLLPHYRGRHPVFWALRNGERWSGLTVHAMDTGVDTGDILYQERVQTRWDDSVASLYSRIMDRSVELVPRLLRDAAADAIPRRPQDPDEGSTFSKTTARDFHIDWSWPARKIRRWIHITPGRCWSDVRGVRVNYLDARSGRRDREAAAGQILSLRRISCTVAAGDGEVTLSRVVSGPGETTMAELCAWMGLSVGDLLVQPTSAGALSGGLHHQ
jgi:methionyl-tRNA formyltransferase